MILEKKHHKSNNQSESQRKIVRERRLCLLDPENINKNLEYDLIKDDKVLRHKKYNIGPKIYQTSFDKPSEVFDEQ